MTYDYTAKAAVALRMLTKFGQSVTLRRFGGAVYDPVTLITTPIVSDYARVGAVFDYGTQTAGEMLQNGTMAQAADRLFYMDAGTIKPIPSDHIIFTSGEIWTIADVKATDPAGVAVLYECRIRQ